MTHISACANTYFGSEQQQNILIRLLHFRSMYKNDNFFPKTPHWFYFFSSSILADLSSSPKWTSDQQGSWFQNTERERKCVNFVKYSTSSGLQTSQRLQPIQLTSSHLIQHAVSCEEMCLSINSLFWLQEVKLFP